MNKSDFYYDLPERLIAQTPVEPRDSSRLLVYNKGEYEDRHFYDILDYLKAGDVLVINNTRVIPARIHGYLPNGAKVEVLLLKRLDYTHWEAITRPAKKLKVSKEIVFSEKLSCVVEQIGENGIRILQFSFEGVFEDLINQIGEMPLPPYIKAKLEQKERYQTVYSKVDGSAAAPTAGLHFTTELLQKIRDKGVQIAEVLLHVGLSTFRPVKCDNILEHKMHNEYFEVEPETAKIINDAKSEGRRIIAVGTTSVRTLESVADDKGFVTAQKGNTEIFIYPSYRFKTVDAIITNFHLPESTLIMLVSAFIGTEQTLKMYRYAVEKEYRFFSFGDATLLLKEDL